MLSRKNRPVTVAALAIMAGGAFSVYQTWRANEAKHAASVVDRATLHAEADRAARSRADLFRRVGRMEGEQAEDRKLSADRHAEARRLLREILARLDDGAAKGGGGAGP
jgi:hypothetical protein